MASLAALHQRIPEERRRAGFCGSARGVAGPSTAFDPPNGPNSAQDDRFCGELKGEPADPFHGGRAAHFASRVAQDGKSVALTGGKAKAGCVPY